MSKSSTQRSLNSFPKTMFRQVFYGVSQVVVFFYLPFYLNEFFRAAFPSSHLFHEFEAHDSIETGHTKYVILIQTR